MRVRKICKSSHKKKQTKSISSFAVHISFLSSYKAHFEKNCMVLRAEFTLTTNSVSNQY